ncbi:MAG: type II toxin-antitoxin system RelE/ParE family toxin [Gammaproteobacteria bacterium]
MEVKWLTRVLVNLDEEAAYIASDNPAAARLIVQRITETVQLLAENPGLGRPGRVYGTRELVVSDTRYLIPYRVRSDLRRIEILRVFHTSRRIPQRW